MMAAQTRYYATVRKSRQRACRLDKERRRGRGLPYSPHEGHVLVIRDDEDCQ